LVGAASVMFWQALHLDLWSFSGPGPGLFPQAVAIAAIVLAVVCFIFPERSSAPDDDDGVADFAGADAQERRNFGLYLVGLVLLLPGIVWAGFYLTTIGIVVFLMRVAERRSWTQAIIFAFAVATTGIVCFGWLLQVALPESDFDRFLISLLRRGD
jgi:hypothetical protein